jgi:signal transduction histidine kinase
LVQVYYDEKTNKLWYSLPIHSAMLDAFHKTCLFQIIRRNAYEVWFSVTILILCGVAWSFSFVFHSASSNFDSAVKSQKIAAAVLDVYSWAQAIFSVCFILGIAMLAIGFYVCRNGNRRREAAENALRRANEALEKRVVELAEKKTALEGRTRELGRSNADLEQFAYAASHDLHEPLRAMAGCVQALERKYHGRLDQKGDELIGMIVDGSTRMRALIEDLLAHSRAGRDDQLEAVDTGTVLQQVLADLALAVSESKAEISFGSLPSVSFVKGEFERLLQNLIGNAIKYRGEGGPKIHVSAERQINAWIFRIADNGIGFEPRYADKIFRVFHRLHTREEYIGTGVGLAIVKKIVERRGGWIWVDSVPGHGSTFYFSVPDECGKWESLPA